LGRSSTFFPAINHRLPYIATVEKGYAQTFNIANLYCGGLSKSMEPRRQGKYEEMYSKDCYISFNINKCKMVLIDYD
jgi:hypothetical protein